MTSTYILCVDALKVSSFDHFGLHLDESKTTPDAQVSNVTQNLYLQLPEDTSADNQLTLLIFIMVASFSLFTICCAVLLASVQSFSPTNVAVRSNIRGSTFVMDGKTRDLRDRIKSIKNTRRITEAMRLVAAARVRRAQEAVLKTRPLISQLQLVISLTS